MNIFHSDVAMEKGGKSDLTVKSAQAPNETPGAPTFPGARLDKDMTVQNVSVRYRGCHY